MQRRFLREAWDLRPDTWDDPRFEFAVGLDRVRSWHASRRLGASPFPLLRKAREWLAAMDEESSRLRRLPLREAGTRLPDVLKTSSYGYCLIRDPDKFDVRDRMAAPQVVSVRCGTELHGLPQLGFDAASRYDEVFWLVIPELPSRNNAFGGCDHASACLLEFSKRVRSLDAAPADLFACWAGQMTCCIVDCLDASAERFGFVAEELEDTLVDVMEAVRDGLEKYAPQQYRPRRPILPEFLGCFQGWQDGVADMRQVSYRAVHGQRKDGLRSLARGFKSCVSAFVAAAHDENADVDTLVSTCVSTLISLIQRANLRSREA